MLLSSAVPYAAGLKKTLFDEATNQDGTRTCNICNLNGSKIHMPMHKELKLEKTRRKTYKRNVQVHGLEGSVWILDAPDENRHGTAFKDGLERLEDDFREVGPAHLHDQMGKSVAILASYPSAFDSTFISPTFLLVDKNHGVMPMFTGSLTPVHPKSLATSGNIQHIIRMSLEALSPTMTSTMTVAGSSQLETG